MSVLSAGRSDLVRVALVAIALLLLLTTVVPVTPAQAASTPIELLEARTSSFMDFNGSLYFSADAGGGQQLWRSDGTPAGTEPVADLELDSDINVSAANKWLVSGGWLYFSARGVGSPSFELWRTDGSLTERLCEGGEFCRDVGRLTEFLGDVYFTATSDVGGLALTDGPRLLRYVATDDRVERVPFLDSSVRQTAVLGDHLYVVDDGRNLLRTDGETAVPVIIPTGWSRPSGLTIFGSGLVFLLENDARDEQLWRTDGTQAVQLTDIARQDVDERVRIDDPLGVVGMRLVFAADDDGTTFNLWSVTQAGDLTKIETFEGGVSQGPFDPDSGIVLDGVLYLGAQTSASGRQLWRTDGTVAGTYVVEDLGQVIDFCGNCTPTTLFFSPEPSELVVFDGYVYFTAFVGEKEGEYPEGRHVFRTAGDGIEFVAEFPSNVHGLRLRTSGDNLFGAGFVFQGDSPGALWLIATASGDGSEGSGGSSNGSNEGSGGSGDGSGDGGDDGTGTGTDLGTGPSVEADTDVGADGIDGGAGDIVEATPARPVVAQPTYTG